MHILAFMCSSEWYVISMFNVVYLKNPCHQFLIPRTQMKSYGAEIEAKSDKTFMQFGNLLAAAENIYLEALAKESGAVRSN